MAKPRGAGVNGFLNNVKKNCRICTVRLPFSGLEKLNAIHLEVSPHNGVGV